MRKLSLGQAQSCENAKPGTPCRCRCGGAMHGIARIQNDEDFYDLDVDDPHHPAARDRRGEPAPEPQLQLDRNMEGRALREAQMLDALRTRKR